MLSSSRRQSGIPGSRLWGVGVGGGCGESRRGVRCGILQEDFLEEAVVKERPRTQMPCQNKTVIFRGARNDFYDFR